jgi:phosphatidylethanolamine-binding protein (PEBP) family uncharacterized protein
VYGDGVAVDGGELTPKATEAAPSVQFNGEEGVFYTVVFTDPDAPSREMPAFREFIHWMVVDIPGASGSAADGTTVAGYVGPAPPARSGMHRYAMFLLRQSAQGAVDVAQAAAYLEVSAD